MRRPLRKILGTYNEIANDERRARRDAESAEGVPSAQPVEGEEQKEQEPSVLDLADLARVLDYQIQKAVEARRSNESAQRAIYAVQQRKQEIMEQLREQIRVLGTTAELREVRAGERRVRREGDAYLVEMGNGREESATLGEILTDGNWGVSYVLDPETVPRNVRKRFAICEARRALEELRDEQIALDEQGSRSSSQASRAGVSGIVRNRAYVRTDGPTNAGLVAETVIQNFVEKLRFDHEFDLAVTSADAYQDATQQVDFFIQRRTHRRGVRVEEGAAPVRLGLQFTIAKDKRYLKDKQQRFSQAHGRLLDELRDQDRVDDLLLVHVKMPGLMDMYRRWVDDGRPPGGPARAWERAYCGVIAQRVLERMYEPEALDALVRALPGAPQESVASPESPRARSGRASRPWSSETRSESRMATEQDFRDLIAQCDAWREGDADGFRELLRVATTVFPSGMERVAHALGLGQVTLRAWIQDHRASIPKKSGRLARMIGLVRAAAERDLAHRDDAGILSRAS